MREHGYATEWKSGKDWEECICGYVGLATDLHFHTAEYKIGNPLDLLEEECAEIIQACIKIRRFGLNGDGNFEGAPPMAHLKQEIGDVLAIITILRREGIVTSRELAEAEDSKINKLRNLFGYELP